MWHTYDIGWGGWLLMTLGMVAFWGFVIYGIVWLARGARTPAPSKTEPREPAESPEQVLKRRLAAGEITVEEYETVRAARRRSHAPPEPTVR